jgi:uncharacterized protein
MPIFKRTSTVDCDVEDLHRYHANPGALNRLIPPWENISILNRSDSLVVGSKVVIKNSICGVPVTWLAQHTKWNPPYSFQDIQVSGPFKSWVHDHLFEDNGDGRSTLCDQVEYENKLGWIGTLGSPIVQSKLMAMFHYRHQTTQADLSLQSFLRTRTSDRVLKIGVTGSSGLIGSRLVDLLSVLGHQVVRILRPASKDRTLDFPLSSQTATWQPEVGFSNPDIMQNLDAVVHLAGKGVASTRWTEATKREIRISRVDATQSLVRDLSKLASPPKALICASAVGLYGDRADQVLDETDKPGSDLMAELARDWEAAAMEYEGTGNRVAIGRLGIALHPRHGALAKLLPPFRFGVGGPVGSGSQYWSWIHVDDAAAAFLYLAANPKCTGPYNLVAPEQTNNKTFVKTLGKVLNRPSLLPAPTFALRMLLGEMADAMLLTSTRANCRRLLEDDFPFRTRTLEECLRHLLGYWQSPSPPAPLPKKVTL